MKKRNLDGYYFRVARDGHFENVCFSDLNQREMMQVLNGRDNEWLKSLCIGLGKKIRDIGNQLDLERILEE